MKRQVARKLVVLALVLGIFTSISTGYASAHVVVKPGEALTGTYETFTVSVPNEKDVPVTALRLVIPNGVESVTPTVKQGWEIQTKKAGDKVTEITWTGGTIDAGLRDEFSFSAQAPAKAGDVVWKAYQTYQDGVVVSWDQKPATDHSQESEDETEGPYSTTKITNDIITTTTTEDSNAVGAYAIAGAAFALALIAFVRSVKQNK